MKTEFRKRVKRQLAYRPFRPFSVITTAGFNIRIQKPEWFHEVPDGPLYVTDRDGVTITWWTDLSSTIDVEGPTKRERNQ